MRFHGAKLDLRGRAVTLFSFQETCHGREYHQTPSPHHTGRRRLGVASFLLNEAAAAQVP
jgi:hypothetical protein